MSDLRDGDDCCDEKSPLVRPPPPLFSTPREEGGEEKSAKIWTVEFLDLIKRFCT